ncbi:ABC transporter substrate-binding protein [Embleya sp. AB8]|uniref:ABC transporter substrate-binding protein n=1 Tax=Embleya sp. AB8 TaxID=3156304 RepID=UPI003C7250D7
MSRNTSRGLGIDWNRRQLLGAGAGLGAAGLLAACSTGSGSGSSSATGKPNPAGGPAGAPVRGGTLRVGALGRAAANVRDPHGVPANESDYLIAALVYEPLTMPGAPDPVAPRLMSKWEPSADLTAWRFTIADNAVFHDGTPVTADDVVWSMRRLHGMPSGPMRMPGVKPENIVADGARTVVLTSDYPNTELPLQLRMMTFVLKKDTTNVVGSPGTGPFRLDWYRDGNARLVRNDRWHGGDIPLDAIEVRMFENAAAMGNALAGGQLDVASNVGAVTARTFQGRPNIGVVRRKNDVAMPIVMRVADGPFADQRVREAIRLTVDRPAMVEQVLSGYGTIANDVLGTGDPMYATDLPQRVRDLARAGKLLDEAGFDRGKTYEIFTTDEISGLVESATLFARQMKDVGVKVDIVKQDSNTFYDKTWLKAPLYTMNWGTNDSLAFYAGKLMLSDASNNEAAWRSPAFDAAYRQAISTANPARRKELLHEVQKLQYEQSGYLLWGMADGVDLAGAKVRNLPQLGGFGRVLLEKTWLAG